jgi:hypothetical protein
VLVRIDGGLPTARLRYASVGSRARSSTNGATERSVGADRFHDLAPSRSDGRGSQIALRAADRPRTRVGTRVRWSERPLQGIEEES